MMVDENNSEILRKHINIILKYTKKVISPRLSSEKWLEYYEHMKLGYGMPEKLLEYVKTICRDEEEFERINILVSRDYKDYLLKVQERIIEDKNKEVKEKKELKKEEIQQIQKSTIIINNVLYEQVAGNKYVYKKDNDYAYVTTLYSGEDKIIPCFGEELNKDVVLLATEPEDYGEIKDLINDIKQHIHKWCDVSNDFEFIASYYPLLTAVYDQLNTIPYLSMMGDTGTGKTRTQRTIGCICYKPIISSGSSSVAALKRIIEKWRGTLLSDESDIKDSDEKNELVKLLNLGFQKGQAMFNCNKEDPAILEFFDPYCPKVISRRGIFKDAAVEARCITEIMQQTNRDIPELETKEFFEEQQIIRNKLLKFRLDYWDKINLDSVMHIHLGDIEPRIRQSTRAFLPLLASIPGATEQFVKFLHEHNKHVIDDRSSTFDGQIVNIIVALINSGSKNISSTDIAQIMPGKNPVSPVYVGKRLKSLHLELKVKKIEGTAKRVVPIDENLINVIKRYCTDEEEINRAIDICKKEVTGNRLLGVTVVEGTSSSPETVKSKPVQNVVTEVTGVAHTLLPHVTCYPVTEITGVTDNVHDENFYLSIIENAGKEGCDAIEFDEKYPDVSQKLKSKGLIYEPKRGKYFVLK